MKVGSLFAGIGGFDLGFERAGFETVWQVEQEPFCIAVLKTRFPNTERYYEIKDCTGDKGSLTTKGTKECEGKTIEPLRIYRHWLKPVDVITAGVPCQDVSVAGKRAGLAGERTGLFYEFARILKEVRPAWFLFENVPGLLSSNRGRDFAEILRVLMVECGYGICWRVLDSQFFGVAQRRRRVFLAGRFGKPCAAEVLFEPEGGAGNIAQGREAGKGIAHSVGGSSVSSGYRYDPNGEDYIVASPLTASYGKQIDSSDRSGGPPNIICEPIAFDNRNGASGALSSTIRSDCHNAQPAVVIGALGCERRGPNYQAAATGQYIASTINSGGNTGGFRTEPGEHLICTEIDAHGVREATGLPLGLDSARYRSLGNAVTVQVAQWIAERIRDADQEEKKSVR